MVSLSGLFMAWLGGGGAVPAALAAIGGGALLGLVNGMLVTRLRLTPLIVTLGTLYAYGGLALALTGGSPLRGIPAALAPFGRGLLGPFPISFLLAALPVYADRPVRADRHAGGSLDLCDRPQRVGGAAGRHSGRAAAADGLYGKRRARRPCRDGRGFLAAERAARYRRQPGTEFAHRRAARRGEHRRRLGTPGGTLMAVLFLQSLKTGLQLGNVNSIWQTGLVGLLLLASLQADRLLRRARA